MTAPLAEHPSIARWVISPQAGSELALLGGCAAVLGAAGVGFVTGQGAPDGPVLCPFRLMTGVPCPLCGMTHSLFAAGQGLWAASMEYHVLGPLLLATAAVVLPISLAAVVRRKRLGCPRSLTVALVAVVLAGWALNLAL